MDQDADTLHNDANIRGPALFVDSFIHYCPADKFLRHCALELGPEDAETLHTLFKGKEYLLFFELSHE
jgi:hypothetical protein